MGGDWAYKAEALKRRGFLGSNSSAALEEDAVTVEAAWNKLSPLVKEKLEQQPDMPCGHSCNTCPTRHDCQLHDAVGDKKWWISKILPEISGFVFYQSFSTENILIQSLMCQAVLVQFPW